MSGAAALVVFVTYAIEIFYCPRLSYLMRKLTPQNELNDPVSGTLCSVKRTVTGPSSATGLPAGCSLKYKKGKQNAQISADVRN